MPATRPRLARAEASPKNGRPSKAQAFSVPDAETPPPGSTRALTRFAETNRPSQTLSAAKAAGSPTEADPSYAVASRACPAAQDFCRISSTCCLTPETQRFGCRSGLTEKISSK